MGLPRVFRRALVSLVIVAAAVLGLTGIALASTPPAVRISDLVPVDGSTVGVSQLIVLSGFIETESGIGMVGDRPDVTVKVDGKPVDAQFVVGSKALKVGFRAWHTFAAGSHTLSVTARDFSGKSASAETKFTVVAADAPSIKIGDLVPANASTVAADQEVDLSGFVETEAGIAGSDQPDVTVEIDGESVPVEFVVGSKALKVGFRGTHTFSAGSHTLMVTARDVGGQTATVESRFTATTNPDAECRFVHGFATLKREIGNVVGRCLTDEFVDPLTGDTLQLTTGPDGNGGMMVYREADNHLAFTDGYRTWVYGPEGVQPPRLNTERYPWEKERLTPKMLREGQYRLPIGPKDETVEFRLVDGKATFTASTAADAPKGTIVLPNGFIWYGDFDGDTDRDAVVVLAVNRLGPGELFYAVPVRDVDGQAVQLGQELLGDRIKINGIALGPGEFKADIVTQGPNDLMSAPTLRVTKTFAVKLPK